MTTRPSNSRHAIILAYHFPPMVGAASERAAAFARHLPSARWEPTVITVSSGLFHRDLRQEVPAARILRTASPEISRLLHWATRRQGEADDIQSLVVRPVGSPGPAKPIRRLLREWIYVPDGQVGWIPFASSAARRALELGPSVLISTSVPISAHVAARRVARQTGVPWVADFRDQWSTVGSNIRPRSAMRRRLDRSIETGIVREADRVLVTADGTAARFRAIYPELAAGKLSVIRNGFEPVREETSAPTRGEPLSLVFVGSVPPHVSVEPLLAGIDRVAKRRPRELTLSILGPGEPWNQAASRLDRPDWIEIEGTVPAADARAAVRTASVNVLCLPGKEYAGLVAAKLYEYLGARRPVLGILPPDSEMERLCQRFGDLRAVHAYEPAAVAEVVAQLLAEHRQGSLERPVSTAEPVDALSWGRQVAELGALLDGLVPPAGQGGSA